MGMIFLGVYLVIALVIGVAMFASTRGDPERLKGALIIGGLWPLWGVMAMLDGF